MKKRRASLESLGTVCSGTRAWNLGLAKPLAFKSRFVERCTMTTVYSACLDHIRASGLRRSGMRPHLSTDLYPCRTGGSSISMLVRLCTSKPTWTSLEACLAQYCETTASMTARYYTEGASDLDAGYYYPS